MANIDQLRTQIQVLKNALDLPNLPADEAALHKKTIERIKAQIDAGERVPAPKNPPAKPPRRQPDATAPIVVYERQVTLAPTEVLNKSEPTNPMRSASPAFDADDMPEITIEAGNIPGPPRLKIVWQDESKSVEYITEGEVRSRFTSYLRDVSECKRAKQGRWADVKCSLSFYRLCVYYKALTAFWGEAPTPKQLEIWPLSAAKQKIFEML